MTLYARQWCRAPDDALQEALIELMRLADAPHHPVAWLFKTVRRRAMNMARAERRRVKYQRQASEERDAWFVENDDKMEFESDELERMLTRLPSLEREIVVARIWGDLTFEQIAELVDRSSSAVHRRYQNALTQLGTLLGGKLDKSR